jgi:RHS repeat-associated protein
LIEEYAMMRKRSMVGFLLQLVLWLVMSHALAIETVTYIHTDVAGTPIVATDASGAVVWKENYQPFGRQLNYPSAGDNDQWFAGKQYEAETGLSYFGARYYDPVLGRFTGIDPAAFDVGNIHGLNRYSYGNNNPYRYVDPDGREGISTLWMPDNAPAVLAARAFAGIAALGVGIASGDDKLVSVVLSDMRENQSSNIEAVLVLATMRGGAAKGAAEGEKLLFRRGPHDSQRLLESQAKAAEEKLGVHGVSVSTSSAAREGQVVRCATAGACEAAGFKVHKTGGDPNHHTVELPKPVTSEVARKFNDVFQ